MIHPDQISSALNSNQSEGQVRQKGMKRDTRTIEPAELQVQARQAEVELEILR